MRELTTLRGYVSRRGSGPGAPRRVGRHAPVQPLRAAAHHGEGPVPRADRPAPVRRAARADLRDAHPRRGRRPRQGDPGRERPPPAPRAAPRALGELAVLARRADRARVEPPDRVLGVPALRPAAALSRLRGLRGRRGPAGADGLHRRLHAHLVGHPAAPEVGDDRGAHLRRGDAARGRGGDRRVLPGARQAAQRALRRGRGDPDLPPDPDEREQVAGGALRAGRAGDGPRDRQPHPHPGRQARPAHVARARAPRARARVGARARGRSRRCSVAATPPSASSASSTRTATSSRWFARSRTRPSRRTRAPRRPPAEPHPTPAPRRCACRYGRAPRRSAR